MQAPPSSANCRRALSPALVAELVRQNHALAPSRQREAHLDALSHDNLGVVVTGQQVGLFLGPAYSLYKAATTVALARRLSATSGHPTVPVFWLQAEDHDAAEVESANVLNAHDELVSVTLDASGAARAAMGDRLLGAGVPAALEALAELLSANPHLDSTMRVLTAGYTPGRSWVDAFAVTLGEVFADEGLLVLNPRTAAIAQLARPLHRRALEDAQGLEQAVARGAQSLTDRGEEVLITPRAAATLSFYHHAGPRGPRQRLNRVSDGFANPATGEVLSCAALLRTLAAQPLCFSTSALLRVVLQDTLLPTVAQVAGPGEARYLKQLPPLFEAFGLAPSTVVPRGRFVATTPGCRRRLRALNLKASEMADEETLLRTFSSEDPGPGGQAVRERLEQAIAPVFAALGPELNAIDPSLNKAMSRTERHFATGIGKLAERVDAARARTNSVRVERVKTLSARLRPAGAPQERVLSFPYFAAKFGLSSLKTALFDALETHLDDVERGQSRLLELQP